MLTLRRRKASKEMQIPPPRQWAIDVAVGTAFLTVGAGGVLALLIGAGAATVTPSLWSRTWYDAAIGVSGFFLLLGVYMLAAVYFRLPLPQTRAARESRAEFEFGQIAVTDEGPGHAVVHVPVFVGRQDIDNATANVRVPDFVRIVPCSEQGAARPWPPGAMEHTSESLYEDDRHQTNYWVEPRMHFSAFTAQPMYFRLDYTPPVDPFPFHFRLTAAVLHGGVEVGATITPKEQPPVPELGPGQQQDVPPARP
jgi:hypothetical protein